jgi:hypothetical protein
MRGQLRRYCAGFAIGHEALRIYRISEVGSCRRVALSATRISDSSSALHCSERTTIIEGATELPGICFYCVPSARGNAIAMENMATQE